MAKGIDEVIQDLTTSWEGYTGSRVEEFIKAKLTELFGSSEQLAMSKCGYIPPMTKAVDGYYHIRGFADRNAYAEWNTAPEDNTELLLFDVAIPISDEQGAVNIVELFTGSNQKNIVSIDGSVVLKLRFTSQTYNPVTGKTTDTYEDGVLTVQRRANESDTWRTVATVAIKSLPADSDEYTDVDISEMLNSGTSQVRVIVTGSQTQATSTYVVFQSITKTRLALEFRNEWQIPIKGYTSSLPLQYTYGGSVAKHLNLKISGENGILVPPPIDLGTGERTETPAQFYINEDETVKILSHGVHEIEAWLSVDGTDIESEHIKSQVMVVQNSEDLTPYIILNNVATSIVNWTSGKFFDFAVYNPAGDTMPITFKVVNLTQDETYLTYKVDAMGETKYEFSNMLEIESRVEAFSVRVLFESNGSPIRDNISIEVDNSMNFAPTSGADFIMNPKLRNNSEANRASIINTANGEEVAATFTNFGFVSDGWVSDENGIKCLRVPSGRTVTIDYEAFSGFMDANKTNSLTIELDLRTHNVTNDDAAVLKMCSYKSDGNPLGLEVRSMQAAFLTLGKVEYSNQNVQFQEGVRTRVTINLLYNLSNSGRNYCRIFVNGIINCEFNYSTADTFVQYVDGVLTSQGIRLGAEGADIDVYGIKVYKKALTSTEVMQDYMASLDSGAEKIAFREKNDIVSNGVINYDLARTKYNVILWKGRYPTYGDSKGDVFPGDLEIHIVGDPEHSGTLTKMEVKGQGTSSMLYYWWNGSWKFTKGAGGTWTDENGTVKGAYYQLSDDVPKAKKLVGKVNFASSMQSHKIGATALFNDLKNEVCGKKSITAKPGFENARSAVIEKPFLFFVQTENDAEPIFKSFMTFGPGKGDEPTFGYNAAELPNTVCIEGADNDKPMIMGRAPWISDDVVYDDEDWLLGTDKNFSLVYGNPDKIAPIQNACNFIYQTYYNIDYFDGTKEQLIAAAKDLDTSKHYWLTQAGTNNAKYDLMRYDVITDTWVDAGLTKIAVGQYSAFNINEQCGNVASGTDYIAINDKFKAARLQYFKDNVGSHFKLPELMFENNFCKFVAASDNRGKNIYFYNDELQGNLIDWEQDDLDTIFSTDNVGKLLKPYYIEEHDKGESGANYWNSEGNSLFNQLELAFPSELRSMMKEMLAGMKKLGGGNGVIDCFEKYFFSVQRYFPAVAYNEVARLLYEAARMAADAGKYNNGTDPMTQSHGDSLQCELQWVKLRIMYMSSFASYGEFGNIDGGSSAGSLNFRSIVKTDGNNPTSYKFSIVPHNWLYPSFAKGQSLTYGKGVALAPRLEAGQMFETDLGESDGNTNMFINGIDYLRSLGDFTEISLGETLNITGERLTEFVVNGEKEMQFRPTSLTVVSPLIKRLILNKVSTLKGELNLEQCKKLEELVLTGTQFSKVNFPATEYLTSAALPATLTGLTLDEQPNLSSLTMEGASEISTLSLGKGIADRRTILEMCFADGAPLDNVTIHDVDWEDFSLNYLNALCGKANADITGRIKIPDSAILTFEQKRAMLAKWGAVDDESNPLYLQYTKRVFTSVKIGGAPYIGETGQYQLTIKPNNVNGNNFTKIEWSMDAAGQAYASVDSESGVLTVNKIGVEDNNPRGVITLTITLIDGSTVTATHTVGFYKRSCKLGDYVFADGTFSDIADENKTIVGICFYINPKNPAQRLCVAMKNTYPTTLPWGIFYTSDEGYENQNIADIVLADNPGYSVYDIQSLTNRTVRGFPGDGTINDQNFRDESTMDNDGFVVPTDGSAAAEIGFVTLEADYGTFKKGEQVPWGLYNTLKIIAHRDIILNDTNVGLPLPEKTSGKSMLDDLTDKMNAVVAEMGATKYKQFYYPAASACNAYEPEVKAGEVLAETFRQGHWALPSGGELFRLVWYHSKGYETGVENAIFARGKVEGKFTAMAGWAWSSTENSSTLCWFANFASLTTYTTYKFNASVVRAVAAF